MDDSRFSDVLVRLGRIETSVQALSDRLDREVLRRVELSEQHHADQDRRIDDLEAYRDEQRGMATLIRFAVGSSLLAAIVTTITLIAFLTGGGNHP